MSDHVTVRPNVARLAEGLRDTGYDLNMAVADLVDNAISAGATYIDVRLGFTADNESILAVGDNGCGMDREGLLNAMRYGSDSKKDPLSKFGLGLKTASTAFCRRLVLASRVSGDPLRAVWDLDHLAESGEWELEMGAPSPEQLEYLDLCTEGGPGTAVIWEKIDRMLTAEVEPGESPAATSTERLERMVKTLTEHLATVFQRFLNPFDERARTVRMVMNNELVIPRDPFCGAVVGPRETHVLSLQRDGELVPVTVAATILPRPEEILDESQRANADITTKRQGIYVYRENRLIHGPDWLGIFSQEPHHSLLRVSLSFDTTLDDVFMVDIKKSRVLVSEQLYMWLKNTLLPGLMQRAETEWRKGAAKTAEKAATHTVSDAVIAEHMDALRCAEVISSDAARSEAKFRNNNGTVTAGVRVSEQDARYIALSADLPHDQFYMPTVLNGHPGVTLNTGHPFYTKVYQPNADNSPLVQSLDFLFFSLAQAELNNTTSAEHRLFDAARDELSRNLRTLLGGVPE